MFRIILFSDWRGGKQDVRYLQGMYIYSSDLGRLEVLV